MDLAEAAATGHGPARLAAWLERRSAAMILGTLAVTAALAAPVVLMTPDDTASLDPAGEVFDTQEIVEERFEPNIVGWFYIAEARGGDILLRDPLLELLEREEALRHSPLRDRLASVYDPDTGFPIDSAHSIADVVDAALTESGRAGGLRDATDDEVKVALSRLLDARGPGAAFRDLLLASGGPETIAVAGQQIEYWSAPATGVTVLADRLLLETRAQDEAGGILDEDELIEERERFAREAQDLLRGEQETYRLWGVAIDQNLAIADQSEEAGPFIMFTIVGVLLIVGVTLRSYWAVALMGAGLTTLVVWLKGLSNLVGLDSSVILDFIVPIAMISLGVDFGIHAISRYREENRGGYRPRAAFVVGIGAVFAALALAFLSDAAAFLANVPSGIPMVAQFGMGAALAILSAFIVLGLIVPLALMRVEDRLGAGGAGGAGRRRPIVRSVLRWVVIGVTSFAAGVTVLVTILLPAVGIGLLAAFIVLFLALPFWLAGWQRAGAGSAGPVRVTGASSWEAIGVLVRVLAERRLVLLPAVIAVTAVAAFYALKTEAAFDVKDFFRTDSDFVVGIDKVDEYVGELGGEPALVYIEGDLALPSSAAAIREAIARIDASGSGRFAHGQSGELAGSNGALALLEGVVENDFTRAAVSGATGVPISDADGDGLPDTTEQNRAVFAFAREGGLPLDRTTMLYMPDAVKERLWISEDGSRYATVVSLELPGTRSNANIEAARDELELLVADLRDAIPGGRVTLTGSPFTRLAGLDATFESLQRSLPVAVVLCLLVTAVFMRSLRYALASIVPILLVVAWLYAFMYTFGYSLNFVTGTIAAISIGVGIDYSIHFTVRFREEMGRAASKGDALHAAGSGTGGALVASALSSIVGFAIMALAPMPMFAAYGLLTAVMILFALMASVLVLPALLSLITAEITPERA